MINKVILIVIVLFIGLQSQTQSITDNYELRPLDEINLRDYSDAYPWISDDGLRLYFCGNEKSLNKSSIYYSTRSTIDDPFGKPRALTINFQNTDNYAPYLLKDELTLIFSARIPDETRQTSIFLASRKTTSHAFSNSQKIVLHGNIRGEVISPSLTPDKQELYLYNEYKNHRAILKLKQTDQYEYQLVNRYVMRKGYHVKSGKLSSDGLKYYLSLQKPASLPSIHVMNRSSIHEDFQEMKSLDHEVLNNPEFRNHQPYFSSDNNFMVFSRSDHNEWSRNNLYIAQQMDTVRDNSQLNIDITVYPNPTSGIMKISSLSDLSDYTAELFTIDGRKILSSKLSGKLSSFDISKYPAGHYVMHITDRYLHKVVTKSIQLVDL